MSEVIIGIAIAILAVIAVFSLLGMILLAVFGIPLLLVILALWKYTKERKQETELEKKIQEKTGGNY
ncbi:MAG: hypothetical protein Q8N60_02225 [Candidatus Diapherotrites archaeon]|nr:hypothetical protein [Candidatus Diapherotrites archaeon]